MYLAAGAGDMEILIELKEMKKNTVCIIKL